MRPRQTFLLAYLASGAAGLLYEVAWARLLTLYLGHSTAAVSTVLAAFMGGLAAGAAMGGRVAPRLPSARALRAYAALEIGVALLALLLPASLQTARPILAAAYDPAQAGGLTFVLTRLAASVFIIALPAALMGATFPFAVRWYVRSPERAGRETGVLYALNTVGAATGAAFTGFILLPQLGLRGTTMVGVALNAIAAGIAWWVARREPLEAPDAAPASPAARKTPKGQARAKATTFAPRPLAATAALALSGFIALTYEVAWTRLLALIIGPTTYAFGLMLAAFIAGLAIGAILGARWATGDNPMARLGATFVVDRKSVV